MFSIVITCYDTLSVCFRGLRLTSQIWATKVLELACHDNLCLENNVLVFNNF